MGPRSSIIKKIKKIGLKMHVNIFYKTIFCIEKITNWLSDYITNCNLITGWLSDWLNNWLIEID